MDENRSYVTYAEKRDQIRSVFVERLQSEMAMTGKKQSEVGKAIGTTRSAIHDYMTYKNTPSIFTICELADYFGVSVDYLLGRTSIRNAHEKGDDIETELVPSFIEAYKNFKQSTGSDFDMLIKTIKDSCDKALEIKEKIITL